MKKTIFGLCILSLIVVTAFIGCSDDDDAIVAAAAAQGYIISEIELDSGELDFSGDFFPLAAGFDVDSIIVEGTTTMLQGFDQTYWWIYGDNNYGYAWTNNFGSGYTAGDTAEITIYHTNGVTSAQIELMDRDVEPNVILPIHQDTVSLGTNINFLWNSMPGADWYGMYQYGYFDSSGTQVYRYQVMGTQDTTFTFPDFQNIYDGYMYTYIMGVSGPGPNDDLNINGSRVIGELHSGSDNSYTQVYFGTGDPSPTSSNIENPTHDPSKIRDAILNHFRTHELRRPDNQ